MKESKYKKLQEKLFLKPESAWDKVDEKEKKQLNNFSEQYTYFLNKCKTEVECVSFIESYALKNNFKEIKNQKIKSGDKFFIKNKNRNIALIQIGKEPLEKGLRIIASHIDCCRLDTKPRPFSESCNVLMMKSHYYGGIKKYQWLNHQLALHAEIVLSDGKVLNIEIGENEKEPVFMISDLLPHLARKQLEKKASEVIEGEQMKVIIGNIPVNDKDTSDKIKTRVLEILNKEYNLKEKDFVSADIQFVPAAKPREVGIDKSMIAGYGHDDRSASYASLRAITESNPKHTTISLFYDNEETGSFGAFGAKSKFFENIINRLIRQSNEKTYSDLVFSNTQVLSADVDDAANPNFPEVYDMANALFMGNGICISKYGGGGGKYSTNEATAEFTSKIISLLDKNNISWQTGELGRIDEGGGGTIAMYLSDKGCDVIDAGPAVMGMHSPIELISKVDLWMTYKAYKVFLED